MSLSLTPPHTLAERPIVNLEQFTWHQGALRPDHRPSDVQALPVNGVCWHVKDLLAPSEVAELVRHGTSHCTTAVGLDGILPNYSPGNPIGSYRASAFSAELAHVLWQRLATLDWPQRFDSFSHVDWDGNSNWVADGVNPLFRFIQYRPGQGELVAHYDAPYVQSPHRRTLFTLLLYLSDNPSQGFTRFIRDKQDELAFEKRDFSDWPRVAHPDEVLLQVAPRAADALVFEHRILHDSQPVTLASKLVARSDIFFVSST